MQYLRNWEQVVLNGIRADPWPRCGNLFGPVWSIYLFGPTTSTLCIHGRCLWYPTSDGEKVPDAIYVETRLNLVNTFKGHEGPFGPKADNIYTIGCRSLQYLLGTKEVRSRHREYCFTPIILLDHLPDTSMLQNGEKLIDIPVIINIKYVNN